LRANFGAANDNLIDEEPQVGLAERWIVALERSAPSTRCQNQLGGGSFRGQRTVFLFMALRRWADVPNGVSYLGKEAECSAM
jgi:hypothetical protein